MTAQQEQRQARDIREWLDSPRSRDFPRRHPLADRDLRAHVERMWHAGVFLHEPNVLAIQAFPNCVYYAASDSGVAEWGSYGTVESVFLYEHSLRWTDEPLAYC